MGKLSKIVSSVIRENMRAAKDKQCDEKLDTKSWRYSKVQFQLSTLFYRYANVIVAF
jgi:hypothetical protein